MSEIRVHERYKASWRVDYRRFISWYIFSLVVAWGLAWGLYAIRGWSGLGRIFAVLVSALFALLAVRAAWAKGKCRNSLITFGTATAAVLVVLVGSYYIGMLDTYGRQSLFRMDLLLEYIRFRMQTDSNDSRFDVMETFNRALLGIELLVALGFAWKMAQQFAALTFCERCNRWQVKETRILPPRMAREIAEWMAGGELHNLATAPRYVLGREKQKYTAVAVHRCVWSGATEVCPVYLTVREGSGKGLLVETTGAATGGKTTIRRERLSPEEIMAIRPAFSFWNTTAEIAERQRNFALPAGNSGKFIRAEPIAEQDGPFIVAWIKAASIVYGVVNLILTVVSPIAMFIAAEQLRSGDGEDFSRTMLWIGVLAASVAFFSFNIYVSTRNPSALLIRLVRGRARRIISRRSSKIVDPEQPGESPVEYVEIVPRENWLKVMVENSTDSGFLQFDSRKGEIRFEGGHERIVIPVETIQDLTMVPVNRGARVAYCMTVLQCRTPSGTREISFLPQSTQLSAARIPTGRRLHARFKEMTSPEETEASAALEPAVQYAPRRGILRKYGWRLALIGLVLGAPYLTRWEARRAASRILGIGREDNAALRLPLRITNVRNNREIADDAPFIRDGGAWTVFDCAPADDPETTMTIAVKPMELMGDSPMKLAEGAVIPGGAAAGGKLVAAMAAAFNQAAPAARTDGASLEVTHFNLMIIGEHLVRSAGKLQAGAGNWVACNWSMPGGSTREEIFFNYDLVGMQAEFRVRRADSDLLTDFAVALRDGPLPLRTAANDPLFLDGPRVEAPEIIPESQEFRPDFARSDRVLLLIKGKAPAEMRAINLDGKLEAAPVAKFDGSVGQVWSLDQDGQRLLADEIVGTPGKGLQKGNLWLIDRQKNEKKKLAGPWGDASLFSSGEQALTKDGQFFVLSAEEGDLRSEANATNYIVALPELTAVKVDMKSVLFTGWRGEGENRRALFMSFGRAVIASGAKTWAVAPASGHIEPAANDLIGRGNLSPDGRYTFSVRERLGVMITEVTSGKNRLLEFESRDQKYLDEEMFSWVSPRYLGFEGERHMFVDVESMKMGYLPTNGNGNELRMYEFSPNMKWAAVATKAGVLVGTVTVPAPVKNEN